MLPVPRPRSRQERPEQRAQSAGPEQHAHPEKRAAFRRDAAPADSKFVLPHHREQYPARPNDQVSEFHKDRRAQTNVRPHITDPSEDWRKIHQFSRPERTAAFGMGLSEAHLPNQRG